MREDRELLPLSYVGDRMDNWDIAITILNIFNLVNLIDLLRIRRAPKEFRQAGFTPVGRFHFHLLPPGNTLADCKLYILTIPSTWQMLWAVLRLRRPTYTLVYEDLTPNLLIWKGSYQYVLSEFIAWKLTH